jgi:UDP-N-acetylmuramoyl-L-alanyl-D-glutamate--2,6-diaminopimelate ligase
MEEINEGQNFRIIVDLAHTPDSFEKVFKTISKLKAQNSKLISVFGSAGGGRDKWKRPELGRIASENSDIIILCNEDPYNEKPSSIIDAISAGFSQIQNSKFKIQNLFKIEDRREAIKKALSLAQKDDIILILGKGTEQTMVIGKNKFHWDDREVIKEELNHVFL